MRLPLTWLREYCDPGLGARELADRLTVAGLELERIEPHGVGSPDGFVVGRVLSAESRAKWVTPVMNHYAYGWNVVPTARGTKLIHHGGGGNFAGRNLRVFRLSPK